MKLFCQFSPTHEHYFDHYFMPSVERFREFDVEFEYLTTQSCQSGEFMSPGWMQAVGQKARFWHRVIKDRQGETIILSDVDVQFLKPCKKYLLQHMGQLDVLFQHSKSATMNQNPACTGFMVVKCNPFSELLWGTIADRLEAKEVRDDQAGVNRYIMRRGHQLRWAILPPDEIWSPGNYDCLSDLAPPETIMMHHANHIVGLTDKCAQLDHIKTYFDTNDLANQ